MADPESCVIADHREMPSGVIEALEGRGVTVRTATLRAGDYAVGIQTRIERKTVSDLHASVISGRLWAQVNRLRAVSTFPILLVEGPNLDACPLPKNGIRGVLVALGDRGVTVIRSTDSKDSARWIRAVAASRSRHKRVQIRAPYRRPVGRRDPVAVAMLCVVPGVSLVNARDLIDAFGTLRKIANASVVELRGVPGIGPRRSQTIHDAFTHLF